MDFLNSAFSDAAAKITNKPKYDDLTPAVEAAVALADAFDAYVDLGAYRDAAQARLDAQKAKYQARADELTAKEEAGASHEELRTLSQKLSVNHYPADLEYKLPGTLARIQPDMIRKIEAGKFTGAPAVSKDFRDEAITSVEISLISLAEQYERDRVHDDTARADIFLKIDRDEAGQPRTQLHVDQGHDKLASRDLDLTGNDAVILATALVGLSHKLFGSVGADINRERLIDSYHADTWRGSTAGNGPYRAMERFLPSLEGLNMAEVVRMPGRAAPGRQLPPPEPA